jgi:hypothetical protein
MGAQRALGMVASTKEHGGVSEGAGAAMPLPQQVKQRITRKQKEKTREACPDKKGSKGT